jgi:hypothetical protein
LAAPTAELKVLAEVNVLTLRVFGVVCLVRRHLAIDRHSKNRRSPMRTHCHIEDTTAAPPVKLDDESIRTFVSSKDKG